MKERESEWVAGNMFFWDAIQVKVSASTDIWKLLKALVTSRYDGKFFKTLKSFLCWKNISLQL